MPDLSEDEFWLIEVYFKEYGFKSAHYINDIDVKMMRLSCYDAEERVRSLIKKNVLSLSPDGRQVKFTDYGLELYESMVHAQQDWAKQPIIRVSNLNHDQIIIRAGETFKADRVLREIFAVANKELNIVDPYIGSKIFDLIEDAETRAYVYILTSDKISKTTIETYKAYKQQYSYIDMKIIHGDIHDRFIIWDRSRGFHIGHSLKDLGTKDVQLNLLKHPDVQLKLFEKRWAEGQELV